MKRFAFFTYGALSHLIFLVVFAAMAVFVGGFGLPRTIDAPGAGFSWSAVGIDTLLVALFGVQHSVMARPGFKRVWTRVVPQEIERSTYVMISNVLMVVLMVGWQPIGPILWDVHGSARLALHGLFAAGWLLVPVASLLIQHFDLFGTRQVWLQLRGRAYTDLPFRTPGLYRLVRHPLYVGWIIAFWATPTMSVGHLLFASLMTLYIAIAIPLEERDLTAHFGERYRAYRDQVPALLPRLLPASRKERSA